MTKRLFTYLIIIIATFFSSVAQTNVGGWRIHAIFGTDITKIIDTDNFVYYLVDKNLYSYNKSADETEHYSKQTKLSDINIKNIFYDYKNGVLAIVYENSNIDFLYDNGKVVNAPDIYNSEITSKGVNNISFNGKKTFVATDFGYAILNSERGYEVTESHNYGTAAKSVVEMGGYIWLSTSSDLFYSPTSQRQNRLDAFTSLNLGSGGTAYYATDSTLVYSHWGVEIVSINSTGKPVHERVPGLTTLLSFQPTTTGFLAVTKGSVRKMVTFDAKGLNPSTSQLPDDMQTSLLSSYENDGSIWELNQKGVRHLKMGNGDTTVISDYFRYNSSSVNFPFFLRYNSGKSHLMVSNCAPNLYYTVYNQPAHINTLDGSTWTDITPSEAPTIGSYADGTLKDPMDPVIDPDDPNTYYEGSYFEGVYKITDNKVVAKYDWTNSPLERNWVCMALGLKFDKNKNLWVLQGHVNPKIHVLPRAKQSQTTTTANDWITVNVTLPELSAQFMQLLITNRNDYKLLTVDGSSKALLAIDDGGNPANTSPKTKIFYDGDLIDQDGKGYNWGQISTIVEDADGRVWMGTNNGVIEFNPANIFSDNFRVNRIKVPRNDGTNYADYLLGGTEITCIAVDGANRKWIGTRASGLYLVSSDGSEIIEHFTADNSDLTNDFIISLCCNPNSNSVYVGTQNGLLEYYSNATPAAEDYSDIYAYPNPVRPDFTGDITITGLMENSLVKIADSAGNVIRSLQSTGGMVSWDGCYSNGNRVKTGVYYVLASQNENSKSSGVVTKILFIK